MNFCLLVLGVGNCPLLLYIVLFPLRLFWRGGKVGVAACGGESDVNVCMHLVRTIAWRGGPRVFHSPNLVQGLGSVNRSSR